MSTTTEHLKALLVDDGREFAMIRKADLAALMLIEDMGPHQWRFLDSVGEHKAEIKRLEIACSEFRRIRFNQMRNALKHGEERRRYMANNKALLARNAVLEADMDTYQAMYKEDGIKLDLLRRAIRKAPATCRMLGLIE